MHTAQQQQQAWSVTDVYITDELERRAPQKAGYLKEKMALQELAARMAVSPSG